MIKGNPDEFLRIFGSMPKLACLYMQGNPIVSLMPQYRKRMISVIPTLTYLDDRPVFLLERLCAEAWANGGLSEEVKARRMYTDMEDAKLRRNHEFMSLLREEKRRPRSLDKQGYGADIDLVSQIDSVLQGRSEREPDNLIAARMKLIRYHAKSGKAQESDEEQLEKQLTNF
jgi:dynein assembly factor 1, axonemal|tara:strand:- start:721 stop:1236 length:516 start_codon:yes stop_codon:yes gene_type:complete